MKKSKYAAQGLSKLEKLDFYTIKKEGCWEWSRSKTSKGYGAFYFKGKTFRAHRVRWEVTFGDIPDAMHVLHHCDNRECTNPDHLFLGTNKDNMADMVSKGRQNKARGEAHYCVKLTEKQVIDIRDEIALGVKKQDIADQYSVSITTIRSIDTGKIWGWLK